MQLFSNETRFGDRSWNGVEMPKKKTGKMVKQLNVRVPDEMYARVEAAANGLGIEASDLVRMMLVEHLRDYEERVRKSQGSGQGEAESA